MSALSNGCSVGFLSRLWRELWRVPSSSPFPQGEGNPSSGGIAKTGDGMVRF